MRSFLVALIGGGVFSLDAFEATDVMFFSTIHGGIYIILHL
jgi:hypothetical protein